MISRLFILTSIMLMASFCCHAQLSQNSIVKIYRPSQRAGSTLDIELVIGGITVGVIKNNQTFIIKTSSSGFNKVGGRVLKNGKQFTAGNVSVKSVYIDKSLANQYVQVDINTKSKDLVLTFSSNIGKLDESRITTDHVIRHFEYNIQSNIYSEVQEFTSEAEESASGTPINRSSSVLNLTMIQPLVNENDIYNIHSPSLLLKGSFDNLSEIKNLYINGSSVNIDYTGNFETEIKIPYKTHDVEINYLLSNGELRTFKFKTHRPFGEAAELAAPETRQGKDYALLIATNEYRELANLVNPVFDAGTIAEELKEKYKYDVETVYNPSLVTILTKLKSYAKKLYSDDDQLIIFFAGHGEYDKFFKQGYVLAADSKANDESRVSYLSYSDLRSIINNIPCKHIFLVLDVCFGGTFDPLVAARGAPSYQAVNRESFIKRKMSHKTRLYITSGGNIYVPDGRPGQHSPFARMFIEALRGFGGEDGILTFNELVSYTEKVVPEPHFGEFGDNEPGSDFLFIYDPN